MIAKAFALLVCGGSIFAGARAIAQAVPQAVSSRDEVQQRVEQLSAAVIAAKQRIAESQAEILALQKQVADLQTLLAHSGSANSDGEYASPGSAGGSAATLEERQQAVEAEVKLHEQTKVESKSRYPVRVTGLVLFNGFVNKGVPDNDDMPEVALRQSSTSGNGSLGGSFRQTILGFEGDGPRVAGARTSASVDFDFFSGVSYTDYGTSAGTVRLRTAAINFDWSRDSLSVGMSPPLISPLSPSSYATVAEPALAGAGNLWTWAPQLRYAHRVPLHSGGQVQAEFGLWDPAAAGYNANQFFRTSSPGENSRQPAYETRLSYARGGEGGLEVGASGYYSRQAYPGYAGYGGTGSIDSWAGTIDFRLPIARHIEVSGEGYRGRALGGLGGGVYKDVIAGVSPYSGATVLHGLNAVGGWSELKTRVTSSLETNFSIGLDDGFASDFHAVVLPPNASATQLRARNQMVMSNIIFRPKTYIILSPEYRRIWTWPISGSANTLDIFTLAVGYQF